VNSSSVSSFLRFVKGEDIDGWITVDAKTGLVSTNKILDRESPFGINGTYRATLYAVDDGKMMVFIEILIFIQQKIHSINPTRQIIFFFVTKNYISNKCCSFELFSKES